ncbi:surface protease GP63, partial [Trypanosoma conorhini]
AAVKLHAERLLVRPLEGPLKVPTFAADSVCGQFTVPAAHHTPGVDDADMVLYFAAAPGGVWALPCATLDDGRPIVGAVNLAPANLFHGRLATRIAAHEIAHALGFSYQQMAAHRMVRNVTGVRGRKLSVVVNSTNAAMAAREHYDCDGIRGMELYDFNGDGSALESHWSERNAKDELMAPLGGAGLYTELTLGAFVDLGFYKANWAAAEPMAWGKSSGCELLRKKCAQLSLSNYPKMFCNESDFHLRCTSDRYFSGRCTGSIMEPSPGATPDSCPVIEPVISVRDLATVFKKGAHKPARPGDQPSSWCLGTAPTTVKGATDEEEGKLVAAVHAEVKCLGAEVKLKMKKRGGWVDWERCTSGVTVPWEIPPFDADKVMCPEYDEVCTISATGGSVLTGFKWDGKDKEWKRKAPAEEPEPAPESAPPVAGTVGVGPAIAPPPEENSAGGGGGTGGSSEPGSGVPSTGQGLPAADPEGGQEPVPGEGGVAAPGAKDSEGVPPESSHGGGGGVSPPAGTLPAGGGAADRAGDGAATPAGPNGTGAAGKNDATPPAHGDGAVAAAGPSLFLLIAAAAAAAALC